VSSASTDSATTVSPDTPVAAKKVDKENVAVKKDKKAEAVKATKPAEKIKTSVPEVIVIEDTDEEDEDEDEDPEGTPTIEKSRGRASADFLVTATVEPPRRPKIVAVQPRRSPRLAGLPPEMEGLGMHSCALFVPSCLADNTSGSVGERNAARRIRRTKADFLEVA
jgi:hypothetical protein